MVAFEGTALALMIILILGLLVPELFRKFRLPYVTALIIAGSLFGPFGLDYVKSNEVIEFFGFLGAAFLMLMAGLEVKMSHFEKLGGKISLMAAMNGLVPFIVGVAIVKAFGYPWLTAILIGTIFISSSVAIVISSVKGANLMKKDIGQSIVSAAVVMDIVSLFLLAIILQTVSPITRFPLPVYFVILIASIVLLKRVLPLLTKYFCTHFFSRHKGDEYEDELHFVIATLIAVLLYFSILGVHPIVAAFLVGLLLSDVITSNIVTHKIHTLGYGLFVPVFFFIVGMQLNLGMLAHFDYRDAVMISIIFGLIVSKFASGYIAGRLVKFSKRNSALFGIGSTAQLTTTLAVTYAAASLNILDSTLVTSVIVLAIVTTILAPVLLNVLAHSATKQ